ncbi:MAG: aminodeoxychorismate synthase component I [Bacteroidota bacterium]
MKARPAHPPITSTPGYVCRPLTATPDLTALHAREPRRYPHLLASTARGTPRARYDILFAFPGETLTLEADLRLRRNGHPLGPGDFLHAFDRLWRAQAVEGTATTDDAPPFTGGWFVYLGYELVSGIEPKVAGIRPDPGLPVASATYFPAAIIIDHAQQRTLLVCAAERADELLPILQQDAQSSSATPGNAVVAASVQEEEAGRFLEQVRRAQEYIRAGDVFQVNLSRRWRVRLRDDVAAIELYRRLGSANPAPFAGCMTFADGRAIISSSPERLVEVRGGLVRTRPIAGTHPRGADPEQDRQLSRELLRHPKERAEHVMLIDLERNDLGRVCRTGTVRVTEFMALESYRHVHHIVSEVGGKLRDDITPAGTIRAVFPGGTITGCPKVRCMQIIAELEQAPRGAYTGSMGYINRDGSLDMNILIRTIVQDGRNVELRAGAGIVADSVPERELAETRAKARGMLAALGADA